MPRNVLPASWAFYHRVDMLIEVSENWLAKMPMLQVAKREVSQWLENRHEQAFLELVLLLDVGSCGAHYLRTMSAAAFDNPADSKWTSLLHAKTSDS